MHVRDIFVHDPVSTDLVNNGVASVGDLSTPAELQTLQYELKTFVCDGQYADGIERILGSFLGNLDKPEQRAAWVSGFYGSGKSHLVKMLRYLWRDFSFSDGSTARSLANLPTRVTDRLKELDTVGKRLGGLHAAGGTLGHQGGDNVRLALLAIVLKSVGLPPKYHQARFVMWLREQSALEPVQKSLGDQGKRFEHELDHLHVSPVLGKAVLEATRGVFARTEDVLAAMRVQFPVVSDLSLDDLVATIGAALSSNGSLPCTLVVLDEVQQWIAEDQSRSFDVQEVAKACCSKLGSRLLFVGTGQSALSATPALQRLQERFKIGVQLSDRDVEKVIRKLVLLKRPDRVPEVVAKLKECSGEVSRHLVGTRIAPRGEDTPEVQTADYPLLPTRRRFWEAVLRAVDAGGRAGQLRTQLTIVHEAVRALAERPLGAVVPADFLYDQQKVSLQQSGALPRELYEQIEALRDGTEDGLLRSRLCGLIFLVGALPREAGSDLGVRANASTLADLLVEDLHAGSAMLRSRVATLLDTMAEDGRLLLVDGEYRLQTRESAAWEADFRTRERRLAADDAALAAFRGDLLRTTILDRLKAVKVLQGKCHEPRALNRHFGGERPSTDGTEIPVWVRDGWSDDEKAVEAEARREPTESPLVFVFLPRRGAEELRKQLVRHHAAKETIEAKGAPSTDEGQNARAAIESRVSSARQTLAALVEDILAGARVWLAGGHEIAGVSVVKAVAEAADAAAGRLFPEFPAADHEKWDTVVKQARKGAGNALEAIGHREDVERHPVCAAILGFLGHQRKGSEVRKHFAAGPFGWPKDAVDGALLVLLLGGKIRGTLDGKAVDARQLDQSRIGAVELRCETATVTSKQRIELRRAFQEAGRGCRPNEESSIAPDYLKDLLALAERAGGDPPRPTRPDTASLRELQALAGNELLVALSDRLEELREWRATWEGRAKAVAERLPRWDVLRALLSYSGDLPEAAELRPQVEAIAGTRALLADPDPVPELTLRLATALRKELLALHGQCLAAHEAGEHQLSASRVWGSLDEAQRQGLVTQYRLTRPPAPVLDPEAHLLESLATASLAQWRTLRDAIPQRFANALAEAAKLIEPQAVKVALPTATIHNATELHAWLDTCRERIEAQLEHGPVLV